MSNHETAARAKIALGLDLLGRLPAPGNLFLSPESIAVALGMTALGARGPTAEAFDRVLHLPAASLVAMAGSAGKGFTLNAANRLFGQKGFRFRPEFRAAVAERYAGGLDEVDFRADTEGARRTINVWVSRETREKIRELLAAGSLAPDSRLVLVNAVYFKAAWGDPFDEACSEDAPFQVTPARGVTARLMRKTEFLPYAEDETCRAASLVYAGGRFEATFLLPRADVPSLVRVLTTDRLEALRKQARPTSVAAQIPRFRFGWGSDLVPVLRELGLGLACSEQADFSGMVVDPAEPLYVGAVVHRAVVALDEAGTEAAAATAVAMRFGGIPPQPIPFRLDRPFLFLIRERATGSVVFLGRVDDPTAA
jgi:serpin B